MVKRNCELCPVEWYAGGRLYYPGGGCRIGLPGAVPSNAKEIVIGVIIVLAVALDVVAAKSSGCVCRGCGLTNWVLLNYWEGGEVYLNN
jgi:hypothetical protein